MRMHALPRCHPSPKPVRVFPVGVNTSDTNSLCCVLHVSKSSSRQYPDLILLTLFGVYMRKRLKIKKIKIKKNVCQKMCLVNLALSCRRCLTCSVLYSHITPCAFSGSPSTLFEWLCGGSDYLLRTVLPVHGGPPKAAGQVKYLYSFCHEHTSVLTLGSCCNHWQFSNLQNIEDRAAGAAGRRSSQYCPNTIYISLLLIGK